MERKALRFLLGQLVRSADRVMRGDRAAIREAVSLVGSVNENMVGELPPVDLCAAQISPVLYGLLYECPNLHCSVFGFSRSGEKIPLHDHPTMHGFITVLRGSLMVRLYNIWLCVHFEKFNSIQVKSFSFLDATGKHWSGQTKPFLQIPPSGNIHEITALEDGSFFFDILVPGYGDSIPCNYFEAPEVCLIAFHLPLINYKISFQSLPLVGRECSLKEIPCPSSYFCYTVPLERVEL
ncbi:unnamed protein product [Haemonchus placei]|uniref:2-aminoethanethiol dioxygenase n=1 Tax=Haemonchus placei TaxID=6290 RepID=A0A0N4WY89_HAEPC|nr:unnamed protein product [Haemonchus placei]